jgi:uncharacterized damage-inducible protein DinB
MALRCGRCLAESELMSIFTNSAARSKDEAAEYTRALFGLLGNRQPLDVLRETPEVIRGLLAGMTDAETAKPEIEGKWSIRHVMQHLADSDLVWGWRLRMVLAHDRPVITGYDQDLWASRLGYASVPIAQSLADFEHQRDANLRLLGRVPASDFARVGVHSERGEESVAHMMKMYGGHDLLHRRQIERIRKAVSGR